MRLLTPSERSELRPYLPDRPGPQIGRHVIHTGYGACWVDRWPQPRAILCQSHDNYALHGDPDRFDVSDLELRFHGMIEADDAFLPLIHEVAARSGDEVAIWPRQVFQLDREPEDLRADCRLRRLEPGDDYQIHAFSLDTSWIADTWGGPSGLSRSGVAWGAFVDGELASLATPFFVGDRYEDIGVVTPARYRGRGLNPVCAGAVARDVRARGRIPSWTTSPDNLPSLRIAEKLGFEWVRDDRLVVFGVEIPPSATPPGSSRVVLGG